MLVQRFDGLLTRTPVITYGLAIPFAVMGTVDTRAAFTLSVGYDGNQSVVHSSGMAPETDGAGERSLHVGNSDSLISDTFRIEPDPAGGIPFAGGYTGNLFPVAGGEHPHLLPGYSL